MTTVFLLPDPADGRIYPKRGQIVAVGNGFITLREGDRTLSVPVHRILRVEWGENEEVNL